MKRISATKTFSVSLFLLVLAACGGGGGTASSGGGDTVKPPQPLAIVDTQLPEALQNHAYTATLRASNGVGVLTWAMEPLTGFQFPQGLSINAATGVIGGTANFTNTVGFDAVVTDSAKPPRTARLSFTIVGRAELQAPAPFSTTAVQYSEHSLWGPTVVGGRPPYKFSITGGSLPTGLNLNSSDGRIWGRPIKTGNFQANVSISDSFTPPQTVNTSVAVSVMGAPLEVESALPYVVAVNSEVNSRVVARGGVPPYRYSIISGSPAPGLAFTDPARGTVAGRPTQIGTFSFGVRVVDSASPPAEAVTGVSMIVRAAKGRNDTPATATQIWNGTTVASLSPYIDPANRAPLPADNDYYAVSSMGGAVVHIEARGVPPVDTVVLLVDGNGAPYSTCNIQGGTSTNFTTLCLADDVEAGNKNSVLDFKVPGTAQEATTFYIRVLDWRGDARPDMEYSVNVTGAVHP